MDNITKEEWIKIRVQGKFKYILFHWITLIALPLSIILPTARALVNVEFIFKQFINNCIINFVVLCVISLIFGLRKWRKYTKMFS